MQNLLIAISKKAIKYENFNFTSEQIETNWLGTIPVTEKQISETENKLGLNLPKDYIEFIKITNGFSAPNDIEPSFESIENIDYLKNIEPFAIEAYAHLPELENAILIAGREEEQYFLLIPPTSNSPEWNYWKFANWYPGEQPYKDLKDYFEDVLQFIVKNHES
ncbi:SMI1/KNR4 family protein SUKH-1 [Flavobacterium sp. 90]|uniref:SMI1/KNR4 family protein n=1 Tax=unclassified Flavobacterium TaxID=196869 RepID=UPI000EB08C05|nr:MULTISPECIES: SMI1/KNR4 family protein [unclassified Flavobacterium]RKR10378.1 SMI1/KNR4 family protein SUKH-1 [Flavobacterium sp. 81]TCK54163.1 SMI1/KNR4 family protein SUKH-1 [Flavobacterium sp. 90]